MDWVDSEINSGKYNSRDKKGTHTYNKCNIFMDDMSQKGWGVGLPRLKDDTFAKTSDYRMLNNDQDFYKGNEEKPMGAVSLNNYYRERSKLKGSGVTEVPFGQISHWANKGNLVLVVGQGHATIAAPSKEKWPLIYRSDLSNRYKDKRTRVGVKNPEHFKYYRIEPNKYNEFSNTLKESGYSDEDVYHPFVVENDEYKGENEKYKKLHEMLREL